MAVKEQRDRTHVKIPVRLKRRHQGNRNRQKHGDERYYRGRHP